MSSFVPDIAKSWVLLHHSRQGSIQHTQNFWAYEALSDLCDVSPEKCLEVIFEILRIDEGDEILANVAAGPLEDLLVKHGTVVIKQVLQTAKTSAVWRKMLGAVWKNDMDDAVWKQIRTVAGPAW